MDENSWQTAYHEAGHMVAAWELGLNVLGATIVPDLVAGYAGRVVVPVEDRVRYADWVESEAAYLKAFVIMRYAGMQASEKYVGVSMPAVNIDLGFEGPDSDYRQIISVVMETAGDDEDEKRRTIEGCEWYAERLISS